MTPRCARSVPSPRSPRSRWSRSSQRSHGSLYKSLSTGRVDESALRRLLVAHAPGDWPLVFAVDASTWARCDAECSPERGFHYSASHHSAGQPIVAGWSYSWISQLNSAKDSWTAPMDVMRLSPEMDATGATIAQVKRLVGLLPTDREVPLFVFDAGYDGVSLAEELKGVRAEVLVRISSSRVFHPDPAPRDVGARGRPARHGKRFVLSDETTWTPPDDELVLADPSYGAVRVRAWRGLHPKLHGRGRWKGADEPPIVRGTVIRVDVERLPKPTGRADKTLWLWWSGPGEATSNGASVPTCGDSTSSMPSDSRRGRSAGRRPSSARPPRPTVGPGSSSPRTPSSD